MKRLQFIALFFLALFVLNAAGYYWLLAETRLRDHEEAQMFWQERQNAVEDLITMKIPLAVPYLQGSAEFEATSGQVKFQGEYYQLVRQKLQNDTLHVVCVRDGQAKARHQALAEFVQQFAQAGEDEEKPLTGAVLKNFSKDYVSLSIRLESQVAGWVSSCCPAVCAHSEVIDLRTEISTPPPQVA